MDVHAWAVDFDLRILWGIAGGAATIGFLVNLVTPPKKANTARPRKEA